MIHQQDLQVTTAVVSNMLAFPKHNGAENKGTHIPIHLTDDIARLSDVLKSGIDNKT